MNDREIEHVHNLSHKEACVSRAEWHCVSHAVRSGCRKTKSIEHRVEDVASGASQYHGEADHKDGPAFLPYHLPYKPANGTNGYDAQHAKEKLVDKGHAPSHSVVLDECDVKPVGDPY